MQFPNYHAVFVKFAFSNGVPVFNALILGKPCEYRQKLNSLGYICVTYIMI